MDMLIEETHEVAWGPEAAEKPIRYCGSYLSVCAHLFRLSLNSMPPSSFLPKFAPDQSTEEKRERERERERESERESGLTLIGRVDGQREGP